MNLFTRVILVGCVIYFTQVALIDHIYYESRQLALFGNLPHRYLGGMFWAQHFQPQREDFSYTYLIEWLLADKEERFIEGQNRPVVPMLAVKNSTLEFPRDKDLQAIREVMLRDHFKGRSSFQKFKKMMEEQELVSQSK